MQEKKSKSLQNPEIDDVNPFFELYALLKDAKDERFSDEEIRKRLIELESKLRPFFSPVPPTR